MLLRSGGETQIDCRGPRSAREDRRLLLDASGKLKSSRGGDAGGDDGRWTEAAFGMGERSVSLVSWDERPLVRRSRT